MFDLQEMFSHYLSMQLSRLLFQIILMHTCILVEGNYVQLLIKEVTITPPALIKEVLRAQMSLYTHYIFVGFHMG